MATSFAQLNRLYPGTPQRTLNDEVGPTATGISLRVPASWEGLPNEFAWAITFTGTITANDVDLQGSLNGVTFFVLDSYTGLTNARQDVLANVRFLRARMNALTGTVPRITVDVMSKGR